MSDLRSSVIQFCVDIGNDPLLVQGAGGNVSWKDGDTLWVKASGAWLADAGNEDIFVPVDLEHLRRSIAKRDFSVKPRPKLSSELRPSIETLLHALMPTPVVVHLHAIEVLAHLVRQNCEEELASLLHASNSWVSVDYFKPGAELAAAVHKALTQESAANVVFLKSHGVVIGGNSVAEVRESLDGLVKTMQVPVIRQHDVVPPISRLQDYIPVEDAALHNLACDRQLYDRLNTGWALYPDHLVFLGATAHFFQSWGEFKEAVSVDGKLPELIFIKDEGVFVGKNFGKAKMAQLHCYYNVLVRQGTGANLMPLSLSQIRDIMDWDAEKYRMCIEKKSSTMQSVLKN